MMQTRTKKELKEILKIKKIIATKGYRTHHVINYFIIANFDKIKADLMANRIKPRRWIVTETGIQMFTPLNNSPAIIACRLSSEFKVVQFFDYIFILDQSANSFFNTVFVLEMEND